MKRCSKCKQRLSLDMFADSSINKDGKQGYCRKCAKAYRDEKGLNSGEQRGRPKCNSRICTRCGTEKNVSEFDNYYFCNDCKKQRGGKRTKIYTEEELKLRKEAQRKVYAIKNKDILYNKTDKGREIKRNSIRKWRQTEQGKAQERANKNRRRARLQSGGVIHKREV